MVNNGGLRMKTSDLILLGLTSVVLERGAVEKTKIPAQLWGVLLIFTGARFYSGVSLTKILQGHFFL